MEISVNDLFVVRLVFVITIAAAAYFLQPAALPPWPAATAGAVVGCIIVAFELRVRRVTLQRLLGAAVGSVFAILGAYLMTLVLAQAFPTNRDTVPFLQVMILLWMSYCGMVIGANKGEMLNLKALGGMFGSEIAIPKEDLKILDTSVIIDGRIADIAETGFIDGTFIIPQFVLRELQLVADSSDSLKRNRGRRGLDILSRMQKNPELHIRIVEEDFPHVRDVDMKLLELAKLIHGKVVTNDFNLNKVAQIHGVEVLNINELANSLRSVVLPGEVMKVFILKEGKEQSQGIAYLDDGTMVVVDNARKMISKTIEISVTSVLQTTAGKMIFGRFDERVHTAEKVTAALH